MRGPRREPVQTAKRIGRGTRRSENWVQLFQFGLVGASGYIVNLTRLRDPDRRRALLQGESDGLGVHYIPAAVLAFCVAVTNNFLWNRHWTFDAKHGHAGTGRRDSSPSARWRWGST